MCRVADALPGRPAPLGATPRDGGTNFAVASGIAEAIDLCLFDEAGTETRVRLPEYDDGVWHGFLPGAGPGQAYGYRVHGPWDPGRGLRCNPAKLLLDPYARAVHGEVTFGPEVFDYDAANRDAPSPLDSAGHVPRSIVTDAMFRWGADEPPRRGYSDTVVYEAHVKGFTMRHPDVPEDLRGTYAGLAHEAVTDHLTRLSVTAVELLPVHEYVPEEFLLQRGLTNYWGYNSIGYFAPHHAYSAAVRAGQPGGQVGQQVAEFKAMVRALHHAGLEVILDVVFNNALAVGIYLDGSDDPDRAADGTLLLDDDFLILVNAWWEPLDFTIPQARPGQSWQLAVDSYDPHRATGDRAAAPSQRAEDRVTVGPRSVCVLRGPRAVA